LDISDGEKVWATAKKGRTDRKSNTIRFIGVKIRGNNKYRHS
jgi:hypothetical protein